MHDKKHMNMRKIICLCTLFFLLIPTHIFSQKTSFNTDIPLTPAFVFVPNENMQVEGDLPLSSYDLIRASLLFSSCPLDSERGIKTLLLFSEMAQEVNSPEYRQMTAYDRGEAILRLMYRNTLKTYKMAESNMDTLFLEGVYNCVSSSVLYYTLAKAAGLKVTAYKTVNHSFCSVSTEKGEIDVETTNPYGFDPGVKKTLPSTGSNGNSYAVVPKSYYNDKIKISDKLLVALIGGNNSSLAMQKNNYKLSIPLTMARLAFVGETVTSGGKELKNEVDITCTNYVYYLQNQRLYKDALTWLSKAISQIPTSPIWQECIDTTVYNYITYYLNKGDIEEAQNAYNTWIDVLSEKTRNQIPLNIFIGQLNTEPYSMTPDKALDYLDTMARNPLAQTTEGKTVLLRTKEYFWQEKIKPLVAQQLFFEAATVADQGLQDIPSSALLLSLKKQCLNNHAVLIHNQYATLFNQGKYQEALELLQRGIKEVPGNTTLLSDINRVQRALGN